MKGKLTLAAALALIGASGWWLANACAPDFLIAVFSYKRHPDLPRSEFIDGRLGVLQPTFARSYLVIAYRYLNGIGMSAGERQQARDYYKDRLTGSWDRSGTDWPARWREVRSRIAPPPPPILLITNGQLAYDPETHSFALNCAEDGYRIAIRTLGARRRQFGVSSRAFRSWLSAQDKVFQNCEGGPAAIPPNASPGLPALVRADRDYQIAAANFYAGYYETALDQFRRIGRDTSSPWRVISRYLVVRTLLRLAGDQEIPDKIGAQIRAEAQRILDDPKLIPIHAMTWNLVERTGLRERSGEYFRELAHLLVSKDQDDGLREALWNYTDMYDSIIGDADPNAIFRPNKPVVADPSLFRSDDLSDWVFCFQSRDASVFPHSLARWKQSRAPAWLLAALSHATAVEANREGLLAAAGSVVPTSPAYLTCRFYLIRFFLQLGAKEEARSSLTTLLASTVLKDLPSSQNLFRGLGMLAAPTFQDFLQLAVRKPVLITLQMNTGESPDFYPDSRNALFPVSRLRFDRDATRVLNRETPFRLLKQAVLGDMLPVELRREALMIAFTRGLMLAEDLSEIARKITVSLPDQALAEQYLRETTDAGRRFAAAFLLLHHPEARPYFASGIERQTVPGKIDSYRDNWWCPMDIEVQLDSAANLPGWYPRHYNVLQEGSAGISRSFLDADAAAEANREFARLGKLGSGTDFLGGIVLSYAKAHRGDSRVPEALHNLVRSERYGCVDVNTWKIARSAFRLLHLRYPHNAWTKRTPTWFKNDLDIRSEIKDSRN